jgi:hypothetical protein
MKPVVRPAPSERSTANQLYSELGPLWATAAAQAGFRGFAAPLPWMPSFQHRYVRLPGAIIAPCAEAAVETANVAPLAARTAVAAYSNSRLLIFIWCSHLGVVGNRGWRGGEQDLVG